MKDDIQGLFKSREYLSEAARQNVLDEISWKYTETDKVPKKANNK